MSAAEISSSTDSATSCIQCGDRNSPEAKFCSGCGAPLWDACPSCNVPARKGQKFCGGCGFHLQADFEKRRSNICETLEKAEALLVNSNFEEAGSLALRMISRDEPRLADLSKRAESIAEQAEEKRTYWADVVAKVTEPAMQAAKDREFDKVVKLLSPIPKSVLSDSLQQVLRASQNQKGELEDLRQRFQIAIESKDYMVAGGLIDQMIGLRPDDEGLKKMALKIGRALQASAEKRFSSGLYAEALARLDAVPTVAEKDSEYENLRVKIDDVTWLTDQVARSPFATPTLGRLVQRLAKLAPHDARAPKLLQKLAVKVKEGSSDPLSLFGPWVGSSAGWAGAPMSVLGLPRRIDCSKTPLLRQHPTRFSVALGLAIQGLGLSHFSGSISSSAEKGGLLKLLRRRNEVEMAWGIDAGSSALRAVKLQRDGENVRVVEAIWLPYEQPLCRTGVELKAPILLREKLGELAKQMDAGDLPVWAALPSRETLGRFLVLPPVGEKQLAKLIEQELETQFPIDRDQLVATHTVTGNGADGSPRAVLLAAKRYSVEQREKIFAESGIKLAGLQAEPMALHNFARYELQDFFQSSEQVNATPEAVCMVDAGATGTTLYVAHENAFWFRFTDGGGEDLTTKLASATSLTHRDAEAGKLNPASLAQLAQGMEAIEDRAGQTAVRLSQHYQQALQFLGELQLSKILCTGGTSLTHGWMRHVFTAKSNR